jgi:hypothetical protein
MPHINSLEMEAVRLALLSFLPHLPKGVIKIHCDNSTVVAYLCHQGGVISPSLSVQAERILVWAYSQGLILSAVHVSGVSNVLADALSRSNTVVQTEWSLAHRLLQRIWAWWFKPMVDLFATRFNHRLPVYVSPVADPQAWAVDALSISWMGLEAYAFPPLPLLDKVLHKAELERPRLILVAPWWPKQPWFPDLLRLSSADPLPLDLSPGDLLQPRSGIPHGNPSALSLHAWLLSGEH